MVDWLQSWFVDQGLSVEWARYLRWVTLGLGVLLVALIADFIVKRIVATIVNAFIRKTKTNWDDALRDRRVFDRISKIAPAIVIYVSAGLFDSAQPVIERLSLVYMALVGLFVFFGFLNAVHDIYRQFDISRQRPIRGYLQIVKVVATVLISIVAIAAILGQSPIVLFSGLGAMTAILILVFKDSILGLVASIQLTSNDMVRIGDWISMPKYGADGDVIDMTLATVKVQNWDRTISTVPAYALISDSFVNWRGMQESGGRRIKRSIHIDMTSVKFCTEEMIQRFKKYRYITEYLDRKIDEINRFNEETKADLTELINGRRLTNVGTFRAYVDAYIKNHPMINHEMTAMVRQLQPGPEGLPIEIYCFSADKRWINYEGIQADIFDHILAIVPLFDLKVFQQPTGMDLKPLISRSVSSDSSSQSS